MVIPKLNIKGRPQRTIKKNPSKFTHKKHNIIGDATRIMPHSRDTYSSSFIPPTTRTRTPTPKTQEFEELTLNTPTLLTPRGKIFEDALQKNKKDNKKISIVEFVPDEDDIKKKRERMELGIKSPDAYFTENALKSRYTNTIGKKRNLSDMFDAVEQLELDDEWLGKPDDSGGIPHKVQAMTTNKSMTTNKRRQPYNRRNRSRSRRRNRTRNRRRS